MALTHSESHPGNYALILEEESGERRLPVIIGSFEAQAIAVALENMNPQRPLTHDLFKQVLDTVAITLQEVVIHQLIDNVFYTRMVLREASGGEKQVEARTSDAIALAVRFMCPIYIDPSVMAAAGLTNDPAGNTISKRPYSDYPIEELEVLLQKLLAKEDYKSASRVRDIINKRKGL